MEKSVFATISELIQVSSTMLALDEEGEDEVWQDLYALALDTGCSDDDATAYANHILLLAQRNLQEVAVSQMLH